MFGLGLFRTGSHCVSPSTLEFTILLPLVSQVQSVYSRVTTTPDQEFGFIDKKRKGRRNKGKWVVQSYLLYRIILAGSGWLVPFDCCVSLVLLGN